MIEPSGAAARDITAIADEVDRIIDAMLDIRQAATA
jgi:hypothetical protein